MPDLVAPRNARCGRIDGEGDGIAHHAAQLGQQATDVHAEKALDPASYVKLFNGIADGRGVDSL